MKKRKREPKRNTKLLRETDYQQRYSIAVQNRYEALVGEEEDIGVEEQWKHLQKALVGSAEEILPTVECRSRKKWMTNDILEIMEERRKLKGQDETRYEVLNKQVKKKCTEAKEAWLNEQCKEIEELSKRDSQKMYDRVKLLTGKKRLRTGNAIKKKDGKIAMEEEEVLGRWKEYVEELFEDDRGEVPQLNNINMGGPPILKD